MPFLCGRSAKADRKKCVLNLNRIRVDWAKTSHLPRRHNTQPVQSGGKRIPGVKRRSAGKKQPLQSAEKSRRCKARENVEAAKCGKKATIAKCGKKQAVQSAGKLRTGVKRRSAGKKQPLQSAGKRVTASWCQRRGSKIGFGSLSGWSNKSMFKGKARFSSRNCSRTNLFKELCGVHHFTGSIQQFLSTRVSLKCKQNDLKRSPNGHSKSVLKQKSEYPRLWVGNSLLRSRS